MVHRTDTSALLISVTLSSLLVGRDERGKREWLVGRLSPCSLGWPCVSGGHTLPKYPDYLGTHFGNRSRGIDILRSQNCWNNFSTFQGLAMGILGPTQPYLARQVFPGINLDLQSEAKWFRWVCPTTRSASYGPAEPWVTAWRPSSPASSSGLPPASC